jgi:peptidoglycan-N-acetylglucosamine deacetylase
MNKAIVPPEVVWPSGMTAAASFTFDLDVDTYLLSLDPTLADRPGAISPAMYETRIGLGLILDVLARQDCRSTFFVPGDVGARFPELLEAIADGGHEIGVHGYTHRSPTVLTAEEEADELERAIEVLRRFSPAIKGYRSPSWEFSANSLRLLVEQGIAYSSNMMDDIRPYVHKGSEVIELPVQWLLDDAAHWSFDVDPRRFTAMSEVREMWESEFLGIRRFGGACIFTMHPAVTGRPSCLAVLEHMIDFVRAHEDVYVATCAELAATCTAQLVR